MVGMPGISTVGFNLGCYFILDACGCLFGQSDPGSVIHSGRFRYYNSIFIERHFLTVSEINFVIIIQFAGISVARFCYSTFPHQSVIIFLFEALGALTMSPALTFAIIIAPYVG